MSVGKVASQTKMSAMITAAPSPLTGLLRIFTGVVPAMKKDYTPCVEIVIETQDLASQQMGAFKQWHYGGSMIVTVFAQDMITTTSREVTLATTSQLDTYVDALVKLFSDVDNRALQDLSFTNGRVINVLIAEDGLIYGASRWEERDNNLFNVAIIPFVIQTTEQDT